MARYDGLSSGVQDGGPVSTRVIRHNKMISSEPKENKTFLDYHFDVRILIYDAFFSSEFCGLSLPRIVADPKSYKSDVFWDAARGVGNPMTRMTAHHKVSLLITCRAILDEASPFFYRAHVFHIKLLDRRRVRLGPFLLLPSPIQQSLRAITKIYLTDQPNKITSIANANIATYITFLTLACVSLKSLIIDAKILYERVGNDYSDTAFALSELWPRLDYLCLRVQRATRQGWKAHRHLIAPGVKWHFEKDLEWAGFSYGRGSEVKRSVFSLDRAHLEKDDTGSANIDGDGSTDTSEDSSTATSDDGLSDSDDDESTDSDDDDSTDSDNNRPTASQARNNIHGNDDISTEGFDDERYRWQ